MPRVNFMFTMSPFHQSACATISFKVTKFVAQKLVFLFKVLVFAACIREFNFVFVHLKLTYFKANDTLNILT